MDQQTVIDITRRWISSIVIGLNLCPFAQRVFSSDRIRYVVTDALDESALLEVLAGELKLLASTPMECVETTLLIHPRVLGEFLAYNEFLGAAELLIEDVGLRGIIQLASFHPDYQFAATEPGAVENYTTRSPYPMLHLLREDSVTQVANGPIDLDAIPRHNIETLKSLGKKKVLEMLRAIEEGSRD